MKQSIISLRVILLTAFGVFGAGCILFGLNDGFLNLGTPNQVGGTVGRMAIGDANVIWSNRCASVGFNNVVLNSNCMAVGEGLLTSTVGGGNALLVGQFNENTLSHFIVGNGTSSLRSNAFEVTKTGRVLLDDTINSGGIPATLP